MPNPNVIYHFLLLLHFPRNININNNSSCHASVLFVHIGKYHKNYVLEVYCSQRFLNNRGKFRFRKFYKHTFDTTFVLVLWVAATGKFKKYLHQNFKL